MLCLNLAVSIFLFINIDEALADSKNSTDKEQKQQYPLYTEKKIQNKFDDVWERIRLGMKISLSSLSSSRQTQIPEKSYLTNIPFSYSERQLSASAVRNIQETKLNENAQTEQPVNSKYIIYPHTAVAPLYNYTALGRRLRFGTDNPASLSDSCMPSAPTLAQHEQSLKSKRIGSLNAENIPPHGLRSQLHNQADSVSPVDATLRTEPKINNPLPCIRRNGQHLADVNKQENQRAYGEQSNTKKAIINGRINKHIALFSQNPNYLYQLAEHARPYLYHIVEGLSKNQIPLELALLPMIESAYQPTAISPKDAAGLWQFIPSTGKDYDLKQSRQYDERFDVLASTRAAIRYLSDLKSHFNGDWLLALAAYNCGQRAVDNAIKRNLSDGLETDYWSLRLPEETQDYVPRLLALSKIFANPEAYGLKFEPIKNEPYFTKVKLDREVDIKYLANKNLAVFAKHINLSHEQFIRLNPGYLNSTLLPEGSYTFLLPFANASQLHQLLISIAQFMAEPTASKIMNNVIKETSSTIVDNIESKVPKIDALGGLSAENMHLPHKI